MMAKCWRMLDQSIWSPALKVLTGFFSNWNHLSRNTEMWYETSAQQNQIDGNQKILRSSASSPSGRRKRHERVQIPGQDCRCHILNSSLLSKPSAKCPTAAHRETASVCRAWNAFREQHGGAWKSINYTNISDFRNVLSAGSSHAPLLPCTTVLGLYILWETKRVIKIKQEKQHYFFLFLLVFRQDFFKASCTKSNLWTNRQLLN